MINRQRIVDEFLAYVQIDSPTTKEGKFASYLAGKLREMGVEVEIDDAGEKVGSDTGNLIARVKGTKDAPSILFSCHMDTVSPGVGIKPVIKDDVIYSDGTTVLGGDDKAGIAAIIEALRVIKENNIEHGPIEMAFTVYEEGGLLGSQNLDYSRLNSKMGFVLDSGGEIGEIVIKGPAQDKIDVKITGKPAHAGVCPEEGISAIQVASAAISRMNLLRIDEDTTANIGTINGGEVTNIVCPEVTIKAEARSLSAEKLDKQTAHMVECFKKAGEEFGAQVDIETTRAYGPFVVDENDEIVNIVKKACEAAGFESVTKSTGGGSDTNVFNGNGIKAINLAIGERKPHTLEEHMKIEDLVKAATLVVEIIKAV